MTESPMSVNAAPTDHMRMVRLKLCRSAAAMQAALQEIDNPDEMVGEVNNLINLALRMALRINDGHMSPAENMRIW